MHGLAVDPRPVVVELVPVAEVALHQRQVTSCNLAIYAVSVRRRKPPWNSYEATTTARTSRSARSPSPSPCASASGLQSRDTEAAKAFRGEHHRLGRSTRGADGASRSRQVADERVRAAALDAALEMRDVAGEPEQLELERERERVEGRPPPKPRGSAVERGEEPRQRLERALVPLLLDEEPQHRLGADEADRRAIRVLPCRSMRVDERRARDRVQLARALVEQELDMRERLQPPAEARRGLAHALRDRADASAVVRVQVEDAVGLGEPERAQDDRLRLVRAPHAAKSREDRC